MTKKGGESKKISASVPKPVVCTFAKPPSGPVWSSGLKLFISCVLTLVQTHCWQQWDYPKRKGFWQSFWLHTPHCWWKKSVDRYFIPLFTVLYTSRVVQDFFHQQYDWHILDICGVCGSMFWQMSGISEYPITFPITHQTLLPQQEVCHMASS